jgi:hypothetical protein
MLNYMQVNNVQNISASVTKSAGIAGEAAEFSFIDAIGDVLDIVNPLQHIPIVSGIYRAFTGDTMSSVASVVGGTLFGGPIGGALALAGEAVNEIIGGDPIEAAFSGSATQDVSKAQIANASYNKHSNMRVTTADWLNPNFNSYA